MNLDNEQEIFWAGDFGKEYINRNNSEKYLYSKLASWVKILRAVNNLKSVAEFGCNIGLNLMALKKLKSDIKLYGYEINRSAVLEAKKNTDAEIYNQSILENINEIKVDLVFTFGVLIHISPEHLQKVYSNLFNVSNRYILVAEYYNPAPTSILYRGHKNKLFKRDFAGELIDLYNLKLVDYGFLYKRDNFAPQDDISWFLLEK